ncbi:hypothetical protein [Sphaerochaeta pleomorpha]|uniref:hypothetical protein n=1 Tax=Sphaerochaeta pleomorpha TaxID=1131707 RepID=UPI000306D5D2|nr:hypothetical protein [Sphaerochaeta pleomorpha]
MELDAILAVALGGHSLGGGTVIGTFFGVLIKASLETYIRCNGTVSSWWNKIVLSALPCFFNVLQRVFATIKEKRK